MDNLLAKTYASSKSVLTGKDLSLIWNETNQDNLKSKIAYYVKRGMLMRLTRGVFAKTKEYNSRELATSIYSPSYISFETALRDAGMIFQHYDTIFVASPWSKATTIDKTKIVFRRLKEDLLFNPTGINNQDNYSIASPERAFLDMIYLYPKYYFDNLRPINWDKCYELAKIYGKKKLLERVKDYHKETRK